MRRLSRRGQILLASLSIGGSALVLEGCDPSVRDTVLTGVQGASSTLMDTFLQAFFESLNNHQNDNSASTV